MKKIVVIGATGMLGKPVTHQLILAGMEVTILCRDPKKAKEEFQGCKIVKGDLGDLSSLEAAFEGNEAVYLSLHVQPGSKAGDWQAEREGLQNVISASRKTGIQCIGYLSSLVKDYQGQNGFSWWMFDVKQQAVNSIKNSGIPFLLFYPSSFMENLHNGFKMGKRLSTVGVSDVKKFWIAGSDYGRQVACAFEGFRSSQEYVIQGLEGYTDEEAVAIFAKHYSRENLSVGKIPIGMLKFMGLFNEKMSYGSRILEALNRYPETFQADQTWADLGKPTVTIEAYAQGL
ncbi:MAG TPA: NmrA family NAD(P)-binding protein [Sphingobacteriaceae bacterium]